MIKYFKYIIITAAVIFNFSKLSAQDNSSVTTEVNVNLSRGLSMEAQNNLNLSSRFLSTLDYMKSINNQDGMKFSITGQSNRIIIVTYDEFVTLVKAPLMKEYKLTSGADNDNIDLSTITFRTNTAEETGAQGSYKDPKPVLNGSPVALAQNLNFGKLNIWIGGSLIVPKIILNGKYLGKFEVTSVY